MRAKDSVVANHRSLLKAMKLYAHPERVLNELRASGIHDTAPLTVSDLTPFDQYHYFGTQAVAEAARVLAIGPQSRVLDVGSGLGGPARYVANLTGCRVVALELQPDLHETAMDLTRRCGMDDRVQHVQGNILAPVPVDPPFDFIISFLTILHIPERERLFRICRNLLRDNGEMLIEDFYLRAQGTKKQQRDLRIKVACPYLPDLPTYEASLEHAGFEVIEATDMTAPWTTFTTERLVAFRGGRERSLAVHGESITDGLDDFYSTTASLFVDGIVGGARIHARQTS